MINKTKHTIFLVVLLITVGALLFWHMGDNNLSEWDESRNGVNAWEMSRNGDYINLYYGGEPDTWNAKPPLFTWCIVICYKLFGYNEYALRIVPAICTILYFLVLYRLIKLLSNVTVAFITCLILLSCKSILGWHVGTTGDYDAMLILWLTLSAYSFAKLMHGGSRNNIYLVALYTGLAFYTKGTAAFVLIPGIILYALLTNKGKWLVFNYRSLLATVFLMVIMSTWVGLIMNYGVVAKHRHYDSENAIETMLFYDTYQRLTSTEFEGAKYKPEPHYFFTSLDVQYNIWNYVFYLSIIWGVVLLYKNRQQLHNYIQGKGSRAAVFAFCMILPLGLVLNFGTNKHHWYMAPIIGFIACLTATCVVYIGNKWKWFYAVAILIFTFTFGRHILYMGNQKTDMHYALNKNNVYFKDANMIITTATPQHLLLYYCWMDIPFLRTNDANEINGNKGKLLVIEKSKIEQLTSVQLSPLHYFDDYCIARIK